MDEPGSPESPAPSAPSGAGSAFRKPPPPPPPEPPKPAEPEILDAEVEAPRFAFTPMHGLLALGAILVAVILWYGLAGRSGGGKPEAPGAPSPAPPAQGTEAPAPPQTPAAAPPMPQLSEEERQAAAGAIGMLKSLQSLTSGGVTFRDYAPRVMDARNELAKYLQAPGGSPALKSGVRDALVLYLLAGSAWNAKLANRDSAYEQVGANPALELCPEIQQVTDLPPPSGVERTPTVNRGANVAANYEILFNCASSKVDEAEQTFKTLSGAG